MTVTFAFSSVTRHLIDGFPISNGYGGLLYPNYLRVYGIGQPNVRRFQRIRSNRSLFCTKSARDRFARIPVTIVSYWIDLQKLDLLCIAL